MTPISIKIQTPTTTYDAERNATETFADVATIRGFILPENGDLVQKLYGIEEQVTNRLIYKGTSSSLVVGNRLVDGSKKYDIVWVADYRKALDVKLRLVVTEEA